MEKTIQGKKPWDSALRSLSIFLCLFFFSFYKQNLRLRVLSLSLTSIVTLDKLLQNPTISPFCPFHGSILITSGTGHLNMFCKTLKCYVLTSIPPAALVNKPQMTAVLIDPVVMALELYAVGGTCHDSPFIPFPCLPKFLRSKGMKIP